MEGEAECPRCGDKKLYSVRWAVTLYRCVEVATNERRNEQETQWKSTLNSSGDRGASETNGIKVLCRV